MHDEAPSAPSVGAEPRGVCGPGAGAPDDNLRIETMIPVESTENTAGELLRVGADCEVPVPPALRALTERTAERPAAPYSDARGRWNYLGRRGSRR